MWVETGACHHRKEPLVAVAVSDRQLGVLTAAASIVRDDQSTGLGALPSRTATYSSRRSPMRTTLAIPSKATWLQNIVNRTPSSIGVTRSDIGGLSCPDWTTSGPVGGSPTVCQVSPARTQVRIGWRVAKRLQASRRAPLSTLPSNSTIASNPTAEVSSITDIALSRTPTSKYETSCGSGSRSGTRLEDVVDTYGRIRCRLMPF